MATAIPGLTNRIAQSGRMGAAGSTAPTNGVNVTLELPFVVVQLPEVRSTYNVLLPAKVSVLLVAMSIYLAATIACALAPNMPALIAARALQGIGGGGILPIAHTIIGDMVSPRERARYQAYTSAMFLAASIVGPVLGGVLTDYLHWTMIFWINLPLGLVALVMTDRALRKLPRHDRPHKLDVPGALLMVLAALALMLALTWGGTRHPWTSGTILGLLAGSAALWVLFLLRLRSAEEPFIPASIMREPLMLAINVAGFCSVGVVIGLAIMIVQIIIIAFWPIDGRHEAIRRDIAARNGLRELSMGMSQDFEEAILEGATMIRIGTAIFGPRAAARKAIATARWRSPAGKI